jgi:hypothetical protein
MVSLEKPNCSSRKARFNTNPQKVAKNPQTFGDAQNVQE